MSNALTTAARPLLMDPTAKAVLMALCDMAREPDDPARPCEAWPPMHGQDGAIGLCDWTCLKERTVQLAVKRLVAEGRIARRQLRHGVVYTVLLLTPALATGVTDTGVPNTGVVDAVTPASDAPKAPQSTSKRKETSSLPSTRGEPGELDTLPELPPGTSEQQWADYADMRQRMARADPKKRAWTPAVARKAIEKLTALAAAGNDPGGVLDQSVLNNWQGLFRVKEDTDGRRGQSLPPSGASLRGPRPDPALDLRRIALAEIEAEERAAADQADDRGPRLALPPGGSDGS